MMGMCTFPTAHLKRVGNPKLGRKGTAYLRASMYMYSPRGAQLGHRWTTAWNENGKGYIDRVRLKYHLLKILQVIITSYFSPLFHTTHDNPGYRENRAKVHSSFEKKLELNTRHEGCTFSANKFYFVVRSVNSAWGTDWTTPSLHQIKVCETFLWKVLWKVFMLRLKAFQISQHMTCHLSQAFSFGDQA